MVFKLKLLLEFFNIYMVFKLELLLEFLPIHKTFHLPFGYKHKNSTQSAQNHFGCNFMWVNYSFMSEAALTSHVCRFMSVQGAKTNTN